MKKICSDRPRPQAAGAPSVLKGFGVWLLFTLFWHPSPLHAKWAVVLLLFAPLVLMPLALPQLIAASASDAEQKLLQWIDKLRGICAVLLVLSFFIQPGRPAAIVALPWVFLTGLVAFSGCLRLWQRGLWPVTDFITSAGMMYVVVGGVWLIMARLGTTPLGFDEVIVLLTAIHFHYAGFFLPILVGFVGQNIKTRFAQISAGGVLAGVPLTAAGITVTQLTGNHFIETSAALFMALSGWLSAVLFWQMAAQSSVCRARILWRISSLSLAFGMLLAMLYSLRFLTPLPLLDIPLMRALHGTANTFGFGLCGLLAAQTNTRLVAEKSNAHAASVV